MSTESDTPRTDAPHLITASTVPTDFARTLERELNAAQARIAELELREKAIVQFCGTTMNWMYFTVEMGLSKTPTVTEENANKMRDFLKRHGGLPTQPPAPQFLERPDAPGWWWVWSKTRKQWVVRIVSKPSFEDAGIYVRATPPQWTPTSEEESK